MRTALLVLLFLTASIGMAQDVDTVVTNKMWYRDTLTTAIDTLDIGFGRAAGYTFYTVTAVTLSGTDTVDVYVRSADNLLWVKHGLTDLASGSAVTQIIITTTPKEFQILATNPYKIRLMSDDAIDSTVFIVTPRTTDVRLVR